MAKGSIRGKSAGQGYQGGQIKSSLPATVSERLAGPKVTRSLKGDIKAPPAMGAKRIGAVANKYSRAIGPLNTATVPGGRGIVALNSTRMKPTKTAPKASVAAKNAMGTVRKVVPTAAPAVVSNVVAAKASPVKTGSMLSKMFSGGSGLGNMFGGGKSSTPARGTNLGVSSGKTTGTTVSRAGTGGRTTNGGRAVGGGYTNAGPKGMGASGRGTGGKR